MFISQIPYKNTIGIIKQPNGIQIETSMDDPGANTNHSQYDEVDTSDLDDDIGNNIDILI